MRTIGIAPKVKAFLAALGGPGILLVLLAAITSDDTLLTIGLSLLGGGALGGAAGYTAPAATVEPDEIPGEFDPDTQLPPVEDAPVVPPGLQP